MKKVRKKILISIAVIVVGIICYIASLGEKELRRIYYQEILSTIWDWQGKRDYNYQITIRTKDNITFSNGVTEKELYPIQKDYYDGFDNCIYTYDGGSSNFYFIVMYEGNTIKVNSETEFDYTVRVFETNGYMPCDSMQLFFNELKTIESYVESDKILIKSNENLGKYSNLNFGSFEEKKQIYLRDMDFEIHSLEIRRKEDGTTMVYLDMDGDGIYEHDCSEYTYEYWQKRGLE